MRPLPYLSKVLRSTIKSVSRMPTKDKARLNLISESPEASNTKKNYAFLIKYLA